MSRSYTSSPPSASMACSGTALPFFMVMERVFLFSGGHSFGVPDDKVRNIIFDPKRRNVTVGCRKIHIVDLRRLFSHHCYGGYIREVGMMVCTCRTHTTF
jgi:hypothetical protein